MDDFYIFTISEKERFIYLFLTLYMYKHLQMYIKIKLRSICNLIFKIFQMTTSGNFSFLKTLLFAFLTISMISS